MQNNFSFKTFQSPNGKIITEFGLKEFRNLKDCPSYRVTYDNKVLIDWSSMGFILKGAPSMEEGFELFSIEERSSDSTWIPIAGEKSSIRDNYNETIVHLKEKNTPFRCLDITFRSYDSGVAFNFNFQKCKGLERIEIEKEHTRFTFLEDHYIFATYEAQGAYEKVKISEMKLGCERPLVVEIAPEGPYVALAEAKLVDYARMKFKREEGNVVCSDLSGKPLYFFLEEEALRDVPEDTFTKVALATPLTTPWRVIMIADTPGKLYEQNHIIMNLNAPCEIKDTSFIKPGKVIREGTLTTEGGLACVDFAVRRNLQYIELDAGWYGNEYDFDSDATFVSIDPNRYVGPLDLPRVMSYAKEKGIRVILYINHRAMIKQLDRLLPLFKKWGVDGIKYGFVEVGSQRWTTWLHECIRKAADYGFVLTIHDEYRPTGYQRTYPNLLTQEGIRGDEEKQPAENQLSVVFTRMLAGPGDNTVCYFNERVDEYWSHAYQLAKAVVIFSPLLFLYWYDKPVGSYNATKEQLEEAKLKGDYSLVYGIISDEPELEFFDNLVTTWDETKVLNGEIGKYVTMARRTGEDWFVGLMNAKKERDFIIDLSFLEANKEYAAHVYTDDHTLKTRTRVKIEKIKVTNETKLQYKVGGDRGLAIRIS